MTPNRILTLNAFSTAGCALAMLLGRGFLYSLFGLSSPMLLDVLAVGLLAYAAALWIVSRQDSISPRSLLAFALVDDAWVVGSAIALELFWGDMAPVARMTDDRRCVGRRGLRPPAVPGRGVVGRIADGLTMPAKAPDGACPQ